MDSEEQAQPFWAHSSPQACKLVHMHLMCLCAQAYISAKLGRIRGIKVSMESGEHANLSEHIIWPKHASLHACMLCACMLGPISQANWVKSERSKYLWNQKNMPDISGHKILPEHTSLRAYTLCACVLRPISQQNWVGSEQWRYLWNWENILDLFEYIMWPKHTT